MTDRWVIHHGDALEWLRKYPDAHFDGLLTDPPAGISFSGKEWDSDKGGREKWIAWLESIMREALRVLKPGAHGLVWAIPRTSAWTGIALEQAGFEIRDRITHLVGNRMPKSLNVSLAIDKKLGVARKKVGTKRLGGNAGVSLKDKGGTYGVQVGTAPAIDVDITTAGSPEAELWEGYGTGLRALAEDWWLIRKPLDGTVVHNTLKWGTGALNIAGTRIGTDGGTQKSCHTSDSESVAAYGDGLNGGHGIPIDAGRWPANAILGHSPNCKPTDDVAVAFGRSINRFTDGAKPFGDGAGHEYTSETMPDESRTIWDCAEGCPIAALDESVGRRPSTLAGRADPNASHDNPGDNGGASSFGGGNSRVYADDGGPSRFMYNTHYSEAELNESPFAFTTKVSTKEREAGCEALPLHGKSDNVGRKEDSVGINNGRAGAGRTGARHNRHPTLKSLSLTTYLGRLILPPAHEDGSSRTILSPFCGAASELIGALLAGWDKAVGIELDAEHCAVSEARLRHWVGVDKSDGRQGDLFSKKTS